MWNVMTILKYDRKKLDNERKLKVIEYARMKYAGKMEN